MALLVLILVAGASAIGHRPHDDRRGGKATFVVSGKVAHLSWPGTYSRLNPLVTNPNPFALRVHRLHVRGRVDRAHEALGCMMGHDFRVQQRPGRIVFAIPPYTARTLRALGVLRRPVLRFIDDPARNQDACQGATIRLRYRGWASRLS